MHPDGNCVRALGTGGLYGRDVEQTDEDLDPEPEESKDHADPASHSAEARDARVKNALTRPSADAVAKHDATHVPYRSWCPICMAASARQDPHSRRAKADTENGLAAVQTDYDLLEEHLALLIVKDRQSGATLAYDCETKGPGDAWVVKQLVSDLADWGWTDVCLMSDGEPAITAL